MFVGEHATPALRNPYVKGVIEPCGPAARIIIFLVSLVHITNTPPLVPAPVHRTPDGTKSPRPTPGAAPRTSRSNNRLQVARRHGAGPRPTDAAPRASWRISLRAHVRRIEGAASAPRRRPEADRVALLTRRHRAASSPRARARDRSDTVGSDYRDSAPSARRLGKIRASMECAPDP